MSKKLSNSLNLIAMKLYDSFVSEIENLEDAIRLDMAVKLTMSDGQEYNVMIYDSFEEE